MMEPATLLVVCMSVCVGTGIPDGYLKYKREDVDALRWLGGDRKRHEKVDATERARTHSMQLIIIS